LCSTGPAVTLIGVVDKAYLRKRRAAPERRLRPAKAARANSPPPLLLLLVLLVDEVEAVEALLSLLVLGEADPLVLGEAVEFEVSPLELVLPLGWLMLPEFSGVVVLLGVWLVEPVVPPVVELVPEVLGV
jgi:hypothetical protein